MPTPRKPPDQLKRPPMPGAGHPTKPLDITVMRRAASIGCNPEEIAAVLGMGRSTFLRKLEEDPDLQRQIDEARGEGKATLRRLQWQGANKGNPAMLIWLGKQMLGQRDNLTVAGDAERPLTIVTGVLRPADAGQ